MGAQWRLPLHALKYSSVQTPMTIAGAAAHNEIAHHCKLRFIGATYKAGSTAFRFASFILDARSFQNSTIHGTVRTSKPEVRAKMFDGIERTAKAVAAMANAPAPEIIITEGIKAVINDPALVATAEKALKPAFGEKVSLSPANTTSEDFSEFGGSGVPLMMFNIGVYDRDAWVAANKSGTPLPGNHSPLFAPVPKPTIQTGITAMTLAVLSAFDQRAKGP